MAELILIRGLPGSGKSTLAKRIAIMMGCQHVEADMYHIDKSGVYRFNPSKVREAHEWCQRMASDCLANGHDVIVSNTFTRLWEIEPYLRMEHDKVTVIRCEGNYGNVHNVPEDVLCDMRERWEDYP